MTGHASSTLSVGLIDVPNISHRVQNSSGPTRHFEGTFKVISRPYFLRYVDHQGKSYPEFWTPHTKVVESKLRRYAAALCKKKDELRIEGDAMSYSSEVIVG